MIFLCIRSQVVIFRPPAMKTKLEESEVVVAGENLKSFIEENLYVVCACEHACQILENLCVCKVSDCLFVCLFV